MEPLFQRLAMSEIVWIEPAEANPHGLVGVGGDLRPDRLLAAYRNGIFPMYEEGDPICWWSPDPRAIFPMEAIHVSRRLQRTLDSGRFDVTFDQAYVSVMRGCADRLDGTWITSAMIRAYSRLHRLGFAHSCEVWLEGQLVGGVYGLAIGGLFAGESMFFRATDASKVAFVHLYRRLQARGFTLFDTQILNDHTQRLGAITISRSEYLDRLRHAVDLPVIF